MVLEALYLQHTSQTVKPVVLRFLLQYPFKNVFQAPLSKTFEARWAMNIFEQQKMRS